MYMGWNQGMDVYVSHVHRRQIPAYVFPNCVRPARPPRPAGLTGQPVSGSGARQSTQQQKMGFNNSVGEGDADDRLSEG
jgi:poly(A) polymerase